MYIHTFPVCLYLSSSLCLSSPFLLFLSFFLHLSVFNVSLICLSLCPFCLLSLNFRQVDFFQETWREACVSGSPVKEAGKCRRSCLLLLLVQEERNPIRRRVANKILLLLPVGLKE